MLIDRAGERIGRERGVHISKPDDAAPHSNEVAAASIRVTGWVQAIDSTRGEKIGDFPMEKVLAGNGYTHQ
jgi:hypothetical protein